MTPLAIESIVLSTVGVGFVCTFRRALPERQHPFPAALRHTYCSRHRRLGVADPNSVRKCPDAGAAEAHPGPAQSWRANKRQVWN